MITQYHKPAPSYASQKVVILEECKHTDMQLVVYVARNNVKWYRQQCFSCGHLGKQFAYADLTKAEMEAAIPQLASEIVTEMWNRKTKKRQEEQAELEDIARFRWWGWYNEYLQSPVWKEKRAKVFARANNLCEACRDAPAMQVHHRTYENVGREPLFDLVAVCADCHRILHDKEQTP